MMRFFDMFSGIGGFRAGLERAGGFTCISHCEIDKHAGNAVTVNVVHAIGLHLKTTHKAVVGATGAEKEATV